jgi:cytochrome c-type biogenesis protein
LLFYVLYAVEASFSSWRPAINVVAGILVLLLALQVFGLLKINWFWREFRLHPNMQHAGVLPAFILGVTFAAGWTPCLGPTLGAILQVAANLHQFTALPFMLIYCLGLAIPFLLLAAMADRAQEWVRRMSKAYFAINLASGALLTLFALLLITNRITVLNNFSFQAPFNL